MNKSVRERAAAEVHNRLFIAGAIPTANWGLLLLRVAFGFNPSVLNHSDGKPVSPTELLGSAIFLTAAFIVYAIPTWVIARGLATRGVTVDGVVVKTGLLRNAGNR